MVAILALCLAADPGDLARPLDLYAMTAEQARHLAGRRVEVFLEVGCPVGVGDGLTVAACHERPDGISRHAHLAGERHDIGVGDVLTVSGVLRVIRHRDATVNGVFVPGWVEVRVGQEVRRTHRTTAARGS